MKRLILYLVLLFSVSGYSQAVDWTTYTERDDASYISKTSSTITYTNSPNNQQNRVFKDYGADFFHDFTHQMKVRINSVSGGNPNYHVVWMLANEEQYPNTLDAESKDFILACWFNNGSTIRLGIRECDGGTLYTDLTTSVALSTDYWIKIQKNGTSFSMILYSDEYSTVITTMSLTLHNDYTFSHHYGYSVYAGSIYFASGTVSDMEMTNESSSPSAVASGRRGPLLRMIGSQ